MLDLLLDRKATLSECGQYRYTLSRHWDDALPSATFIMLNPSTADAWKDDPTIKKCMGFARRWGMGSIFVGNLFAFRATKPADMMKARDPVGPDNRKHLMWMCDRASQGAGEVICAWGVNGCHMNQERTVIGWLREWEVIPKALRMTEKTGKPEHPLYVPYDAVPVRI